MRKLLAGIAAAATLLGCAALGTASASADGAETITIVNAQQGHTYKAYQVADFTNVQFSDDDNTITSMDIDTDSDTELNTALKQAIAKVGLDIPAEYANNPMAFVATFTAQQARTFADYFNEDPSVLPNEKAAATTTVSTEGAPSDQTLSVPQGWYLVTDSMGESHFRTALVASTVSGKSAFKTVKTDEQAALTDQLGSFYAKNENAPVVPYKDAFKDNTYTEVRTGSVNIGDTVYYQVRTSVPRSATDRTDYTIAFTDTANKGLQIGEEGISVCHRVKTAALTDECTAVSSADFSVEQTGSDSSQTITTVTVRNVYKYVGDFLYLRYSALVTSNVLGADGTGRVLHNEATVSHNGGTSSDAGVTNLYVGDLKFYKYGIDNNSETRLKNVGFTVHRGSDASAGVDGNLKFSLIDENTPGVYRYDPEHGSETVSTGEGGVLFLKGLESGVYTFAETNPAAGYAQNFKPVFTVDMSINPNRANPTDVPSIENPLTDDNNIWKLADSWQDGNSERVKVKNVKSAAQLPLTGGAGLILFSAIAVLLVAAAAVITVKIRSVRRELQA